MRKILISIFFVSLLSTSFAHGEGATRTYGLGLKTCGWLLSNNDREIDKLLYMTYIGGYISGANKIARANGGEDIGLEFDVLYDLAMKKCRDNPKNFFSSALDGVIIDAWKSKKK